MASRLFKTALIVLLLLPSVCYPLLAQSPEWANLSVDWQSRILRAWHQDIELCVVFWLVWWARESLDGLLDPTEWNVVPAKRRFRVSPAAPLCIASLGIGFATAPLNSVLLAGLLFPTGASVLLIMGGNHA